MYLPARHTCTYSSSVLLLTALITLEGKSLLEMAKKKKTEN